MTTADINAETLAALEDQGGSQDTIEATGELDTDKDKTEKLPEDIDLHLEDTGDTDKDGGGTDDTQTGEDSTDINVTVDQTLKDAGFDVDAIAKEITETGVISDELIAKAKEKLDPALVDAHVGRLRAEIELKKIQASDTYKENQEANKATQEMNEYVFKSVGGEDKFKVLGDTLKDTMSKEDLGVINAKLLSGNKSLVNEGLTEAVSAYKKAKGFGGNLMEGDGNVSVGEPTAHITKEDFRAIIRTDKYKTDPVFRDKTDTARLKSIEADKKKYGPGTYYGFNQNGRYEL